MAESFSSSPAKKARTSVEDEEGNPEGDRDRVLLKYKQDKNLLSMLFEAVLHLDHGYSDLLATCQEIEFADASKEKSFSRAVCVTSDYTDDTPLAIGALFRTGLEVVLHFINATDNTCIPSDESSKKALIKLLTFLSSKGLPTDFFHPECFSECQWTVILAQHLLSKLSLQSDYTIDDHSQGHSSVLKLDGQYHCACKNRDLMVGRFGDTSFGCPNGWHGDVDILFENGLPTTVAGTQSGDTEEESDDDRCSVLSDTSETSIDENAEKKISQQDVMQMTSQCITFSFLQKKRDSTLKNYLIPALGISKSKLKVLLFDCDNDILLTSEDLDITESENKLNIPVIMLLWLTLNYKIFCTGVPDIIKKFKANFEKCAGDKMNAYREDVHYKFPENKTETKTFRYGINPNPLIPFPFM